MSGETRSRVSGRLVAGILLILIGVLFTLDAFGVLQAGDVFDYWPAILIGVGLVKIFGARRGEQRVGGGVLVVVGVLFLLRELNLFSFRFRDLWPVIFVLGGGALLWQALRKRPTTGEASDSLGARALEGMRAGLEASAPFRGEPTEAGSTLNEFAFMGANERVVRSQEFHGGDMTAVLAGCKIDLRGAEIAGDSATIEVFTLWGGVEILVPQHWSVAMHGTPILGAFINSTSSATTEMPRKTLVVHGTAIMGAVEVKG